MTSLVTGGTGFIGKNLIDRLLARDEKVVVLVRQQSVEQLKSLIKERWKDKAANIQPLLGDICEPMAGVGSREIERLREEVTRIYHLAALYDMNMSEEMALNINVNGTTNVINLCKQIGCTLHHVSSIAVTGGSYAGVFTEAMFEEGQRLDHPYYQTKFASESLVREALEGRYKIYRPGIVVGDSKTGEIDKLDGPYYMFPLLALVRKALPKWFPMVGLQQGFMSVVPVDYVATAIDEISHASEPTPDTFHLVGNSSMTIFEVLNSFMKASGGPSFVGYLSPNISKALIRLTKTMMNRGPYAATAKATFYEKTGIPASTTDILEWETRFDSANTQSVLGPMGVHCPELPDYAGNVWRYWEQSDDLRGRLVRRKVARARKWTSSLVGKRVLITGASSGIGKSLAKKVAAQGGIALLVARSADKLEQLQNSIRAVGGEASIYPCDLTDEADVKQLLAKLAQEPAVDILVNNAGRSIRRSLTYSYDRIHDYERTMQLNYFGALRITLGLLPRMREERNGHVIHVSSIGVPVHSPRFSAYLASKAAFDEFSRTAAGEVLQDNVHFSIIYMPLVRTEMIAPTASYKHSPALSADSAADMILRAMRKRPARVISFFAAFMQTFHALMPKLALRGLSMGYRYTSSSKHLKA